MKRRARRGERLNLRLTKSQRARIEEEAEAEGISMTDLIVRRACGESSDHGSPPASARSGPDHGGSHIDAPDSSGGLGGFPPGAMPGLVKAQDLRNGAIAAGRRREEARERAKEALAGSG